MPQRIIKKTKIKKVSQEILRKPIIPQEERKDRGLKEVFFMATGKRKTAVAQIKFYPKGKREIFINNKILEEYFPYFVWQEIIKGPISLTGLKDYKIAVKVEGGGTKAQAEAIRLGISRALVKINPEFKSTLKKVKFLTRDARVKERKKPGLKRARRAPQWQKR